MPDDPETTRYIDRLGLVRLRLETLRATSPAAERSLRRLRRIERALRRPLRVVLLGEPNSGKTTLANLLIGRDVLVADILENTRAPVRVRYAEETRVEIVNADGARRRLSAGAATGAPATGDRIEIALPLPALAQFEVIDTPGSWTREADGEQLARCCRRADVVVWCTVATQAWRRTERAAWLAIEPRACARGLLVATHADAIDADDRQKLTRRLDEDAAGLFAHIALLGRPDLAADGGGDASPPDDVRAVAVGAIEPLAATVRARRLAWARRIVARLIAQLGT